MKIIFMFLGLFIILNLCVLPCYPEQSDPAPEAKQEVAPEDAKLDRIEPLYQEAMIYFYDGDYDSAREVFNYILDIDPEQRKAKEYLHIKIPRALKQEKIKGHYEKAFAYFDSKKYSRAKAVFRKILSLDPAQEKARQYIDKEIPLAIAKMKESKGKKVWKSADRQKKYGPSPAPAQDKPIHEVPAVYPKKGMVGYLYENAFSCYKKGDFDSAAGYFEKILIMDPSQKLASAYLKKSKQGN